MSHVYYEVFHFSIPSASQLMKSPEREKIPLEYCIIEVWIIYLTSVCKLTH